MLDRLEKFFREPTGRDLIPSLNSLSKTEQNYLSGLTYPFHFQVLLRGGWINKQGTWFLPNWTSDYKSTVRTSLVNFKGGDIFPYAYKDGFVLQGFKQPNNTRFDKRESALRFLEFTFNNESVCRMSYEKIKNIARIYTAVLPKIRYRINFVDCSHYEIFNIVKKEFISLPFFLMEINKLKSEAITNV